MSASKIPLHGRNHLPGGSDPIPRFNNALGYPTVINVPIFSWNGSQDQNLFQTVTLDSACVHNARRSNVGNDQAYFVEHLRLGPYGSRWQVSVRHTKGPNHGILYFYWGTPTEDGTPSEGWTIPDGLMQSSDTGSPSVTYIPYNLSDVTGYIDGYAAGSDKNVLTTSRSQFRILGQLGDVLTAFDDPLDPGPLDPDGNIASDGGPGLYNLKLLVDGKNASSSGYEFGISELRVHRIDELGF